MGKSTTFLWPFSIAMLVHQRVCWNPKSSLWTWFGYGKSASLLDWITKFVSVNVGSIPIIYPWFLLTQLWNIFGFLHPISLSLSLFSVSCLPLETSIYSKMIIIIIIFTTIRILTIIIIVVVVVVVFYLTSCYPCGLHPWAQDVGGASLWCYGPSPGHSIMLVHIYKHHMVRKNAYRIMIYIYIIYIQNIQNIYIYTHIHACECVHVRCRRS